MAWCCVTSQSQAAWKTRLQGAEAAEAAHALSMKASQRQHPCAIVTINLPRNGIQQSGNQCFAQ